MKNGLLVTSPISSHKNIGDYMQSVAALQFTPEVEVYIEKETVSRDPGGDDNIKAIMNAWYIWHPENWPPHPKILPLLTSVHMSPLTARAMVEGGKREYMIQHGPIGCRDLSTLEFLKAQDIPSYFSGCLTLTLGEKYKSIGPRSGVVFVDPYISPLRDKVDGRYWYYYINVLKFFAYFLKAPLKVRKLAKKKFFKARLPFMNYYNAAMFINAYKTRFSMETLLNARYVSHMVEVKDQAKQEDLLAAAEELLGLYATSQLVVTSRIHCALPCLGLETPVIFVIDETMNSKKNVFNAPGRFDGLIDFFRVMIHSTGGLSTNDDILDSVAKIDDTFSFENKVEHLAYRDKLIEQCRRFFASN